MVAHFLDWPDQKRFQPKFVECSLTIGLSGLSNYRIAVPARTATNILIERVRCALTVTDYCNILSKREGWPDFCLELAVPRLSYS